MNKKKIFKISSVVVFSVLIVSLIVSVLVFLFSTTSNPQKFCKENSFKNSEEFEFYKTDKAENYLFILSTDNRQSKAQELFVFRKKNFGLIKNTNRYVLEFQSSEENTRETVGGLKFNPLENSKDKKDANASMNVWFSTNPEEISKIEYTENCEKDGVKKEKKTTFDIAPLQEFVVFTDISYETDVTESVKFYNAQNEEINGNKQTKTTE